MIIQNIILITLLSIDGCNCTGKGGSILINGDFENPEVLGWELKTDQGVKVILDEMESYSGARSIMVENLTRVFNVHYGCNQVLSAPAHGTWLKLKVAIKTHNLNGRVGVDIHFRDTNYIRIPKYDANFSLRSKGEGRDWEMYSLDFRIPEGTDRILVALFLIGHGTAWFDNLSLACPKMLTNADKNPSNGAYLLRKRNPMVWFEYAEQKVFHETPPPTDKIEESIKVAGARNEWESFQIVIIPNRDFKKCTVEFSDIVNEMDHSIIKGNRIKYFFVGYVDVSNTSTPYGIAGFNPDYLLSANDFDLVKHRNNPIWIRIEIPVYATSGIHHGEIILKTESKIFARIPLKVTVWDFDLSEDSHLSVKSDFTLHSIKKFDLRENLKILQDYYLNLKNHRINSFGEVELETILLNGDLICAFDEFDDEVTNLFENYGCKFITVGPFIGDVTGWEFRKEWLGMDPESPEFNRVLRSYCRQLEKYLYKKGWLNRCWIYYWDEPQFDDPYFEKIVEVGKIIKESAPNLKIFMTKWPIHQLFGIVDIWCLPFKNVYFQQEIVQERRRLGEKVFIYNNDPYIDTPLIDKRLYSWRFRLADIDGVYAWWNLTYWLNSPYENPRITLTKRDGSKFNLKSGNGVLLYPNPHGSGPPTNSLRWEIFREGLEDYEYLWLLKRNIKRALAHLKKNEAFINFAEYRVKEIVNELVKDYFSKWTHDVKYLHEVRQRLAEEIQVTYQRPYVLIKTIKQNKKDAIKVLGLTERGTRIFVNDKAITVTSNGSFFEETHLLDDGSILIRAEFRNREKIIKQFVKRIAH